MANGGTSRRSTPTFYDRVYDALSQVPAGRVTTYGEIARLLGAPMAARAVGYALRAIPNPDELPWWRVLNAAGRISPRAPGLGAESQRRWLEEEGVEFDPSGAVDLRRFEHAFETPRSGEAPARRIRTRPAALPGDQPDRFDRAGVDAVR